ncbi:autotransporter domain-containing protein [Methylotenera sp. 1P/1]|uniref:autotransporter domain-containing protein n=1 Tax=Methylotenera sp. 1P/1 TaxID=1131551 RepID=UPI0003798BEA|nr:autotransporter domain-containing protein [Methylotenera sp. 1P/1]
MNRSLKFNPSKSNRIKLNNHLIRISVLSALNYLAVVHSAYADPCVDNGDGTYSCSSASQNVDTSLAGRLIIDNSSGTATFSNITTETSYSDTFGGQATITHSSNNVGATSAISFSGNYAVTINNIGGLLTMDRSAGNFNPAGWSTDLDGLLYNDRDGLGPVLAGYAAVISAGANVDALTINNMDIYNVAGYPNSTNSILGFISSSGDFSPTHFTATVFTNTPLLTINNTTNGGFANIIGNVVSFGAGTTLINTNGGGLYGNIYAVDRNPLLVAAQTQYFQQNGVELPLAYSTDDVGIRNSTINNSGFLSGNIYLGSGEHVINSTNANGFSSNIFIDQREVAVVDVVGGVATPQTPIHGARTFTMNDITDRGGYSGQMNIIATADSVNTINISAQFLNGGSFTANGLGINTLNLNCANGLTSTDTTKCQIINSNGNVTGFTSYNLTGNGFKLGNNVNVTDSINLNANLVELTVASILTAPLITIGQNTTVELLQDSNNPTNPLNIVSRVAGNLVNNGTINLNSNTLEVDGNLVMNAGSKVQLNVTPTTQGHFNNTGTATFDAGSTLAPVVNLSAFGTYTNIRNGETRTIANNASGIPTIENANSLLQWLASTSTGDLVITANIGVTDFLAPKLTTAAKNAVDALFSYTGSESLFLGLQAQLLAQRDENLVQAAERLHPETNDGAFRMVQGNTDKVFGILESRLTNNYLKATPENMQVATTGKLSNLEDGSPTLSKAIWVQGFGDRGLQNGLQQFDGYTSSAAGFAAGIDQALDAAGNQQVGFAVAYARGNVTNTGNTVNNRSDINSFLGAAYASWAMDNWYINGMVGVGRNTYETYRRLLENTAIGRHDSWQFSSRVDVGMPLLMSDSFTFIPLASLDYSHIKESGYSENGKSLTPLLDSTTRPDLAPQPVYINGIPQFNQGQTPTNLKIDGRTFDSVRGGFGAKAIYTLQQNDWAAELELHGLYRHEFGDIAQDTTARFAAGGNSFLSPGINPVRDDFVLGASLRLTGDDENDQVTLLTTYDANIRKQYFGQTMTLNLRYDFDKAPSYKTAAKAKLANMAAKKVPEQKFGATEKDIAAINQAIQPETQLADDENVLDENQQAIDTTIKNWTAALGNKNLDVYFNTYATDFITPDGSSRQQWERKRKAEISKENNPAINVSYLTIEPNGNQAIAVFTQTMVADAQQTSVRKVVGLENRDGRWLIVRENSMAISQ